MPGQQPIAGIDDSNNDMSHQPGDQMQGGDPGMLDGGVQQNNFTEDEIQNLRSIFEMFDPNRTGAIEVKDLETIMGSL